MGLLDDVKLGVRHPKLLGRKLNQLVHSRFGRWEYNRNGIDIFDRDWDNLVILDACRRDMLGDELFGEPVETVESRGSGTIEFLRGNVANRDLTDTVYVTANPQLYRNRDRFDPDFHDVINVWMEDGWDEEYGTVLPETMYERTVEAAEKYPNKRLLSHFIQPHYPFLDSDSKFGIDHMRETNGELQLWMQATTKEIKSEKLEELISSYRNNLEIVLPVIEDLVRDINGKTVITSDHGNLLGEQIYPVPIRDWGHPLHLYAEQLVTVPWVSFDADQRRQITAEYNGQTTNSTVNQEVGERLRDLGYK